MELCSRPQHPPDLLQRSSWVGHGTQREGTQRTIARTIFKVKLLTVKAHEVHRYVRGGLSPAGGSRPGQFRWLNRIERMNLFWKKPQVVA